MYSNIKFLIVSSILEKIHWCQGTRGTCSNDTTASINNKVDYEHFSFPLFMYVTFQCRCYYQAFQFQRNFFETEGLDAYAKKQETFILPTSLILQRLPANQIF